MLKIVENSEGHSHEHGDHGHSHAHGDHSHAGHSHDEMHQIADETITLVYDDRKRGRFKSTTDSGAEVGLFLERGKVLQHGQQLTTECGKVVSIVSKPEAVVTASCDDWTVFAKCCYHLGNRHVPLQVGDRWLRFKPDHVLEEMVHLHGMSTIQEEKPFEPESGAYKGGHHHHD